MESTDLQIQIKLYLLILNLKAATRLKKSWDGDMTLPTCSIPSSFNSRETSGNRADQLPDLWERNVVDMGF